jgi:NAD(P)-dependent dehydrogenase (short-subunit alcohol dehydrogenase family)
MSALSSTYLITGANRGIGLELARALRRRGGRVIGTAREPGQARELAELDVRLEQLDVSDSASTTALAHRLSGEPIDYLINNAGIYGRMDSLGEIDIDRLPAVFNVNALGALRMTQALLPNLRAGTRKCVVQMTSKMGSIEDNQSGGSYAYRASKAALNAINKSLAVDLAPEGFVCVCLHPGWVRTAMGGAGAPLDSAASAAALVALIHRLTREDNGLFLDYLGKPVPW